MVPTVADEFIRKGYVIRAVEARGSLQRITDAVVGTVRGLLSVASRDCDLNQLHKRVDAASLNELRLEVLAALDRDDVRRDLYRIAASVIDEVVGNELAIQRRVGLSIQLPNDDSSLLPLHCDTWNGNSAYEVVLWLPLVDCWGTKSMYVIDPKISPGDMQSPEAMFEGARAAQQVKFLTVNYGQYLLFTPTMMHGNRVNETKETRWSINCRFKSLFTPYAEKRLGEFFTPLNIKPATRIGMKYKLPRTATTPLSQQIIEEAAERYAPMLQRLADQ